MIPFKEKRAYTLQRDFCVLEREKRVSKILGSHAFRTELEGILRGQLDGSRSPPKPSRALGSLQENVALAAGSQTARIGGAGGGSSAASSVIPINDLRGARSSRYVLSERQLRCKLASLCRLVDWFRWSHLVDNHVSARDVGERGEFLVNPFGLLYGEVTASSLVRVSGEGAILDGGSTRLGVNRAGLELHSAIYGARRDVQCVMHLRTVAGAAVSVMSCGLLPISEEALRVGKVSYYDCRRRPLDQGQRERKEFASALGKNKVLILRNHGLVAVGSCVEECFRIMYNLIQACQIQVAAASAGLPNLTQIPLGDGCGREENVGGAGAWRTKGQMEFEALMRMLDNQGYQTGYRYRGLGLLEAEGDSGRAAVWEDVVEGGETDAARKLRQRRALKEKAKRELEAWSFLDDDRSRDQPLTKNTKIRVRAGLQRGSVSPVEEEEEADPWQFLTSREPSVLTPDSKAQRLTNTSGGSGTATEDPVNSHHHSSASGARRRLRKRRKSNSTSSRTPTPAEANPTPSHPQTAVAPATTLPPPDLSNLEQTAERVAHSTGVAVQKLSLKRLPEEGREPERALSEPNLVSTWDHLTASNHDPPHYYQRPLLLVDSQGYSSGDEASNLGSPRRPVQTGIARPQGHFDAAHFHTSPSHHTSPQPITSGGSTPHPSHTHPPLTHSPADISYPDGYSSAERAAYVARLVADSTSSAVQKLSETMTERQQLSLSDPTTPTHTAQI